MNQQLIKTYLQAYKDNFATISKQELYKWKAVKQFQDHWNIEADDFYSMVKKALDKVKNLMDAGKYFPKRMILRNAEVSPYEVRNLFRNLFNEEVDLVSRINEFQSNFIALNSINFNEKNHYQDHRAIVVYLSLKYPERYYFYKYGMCNDFVKLINYPFKPVKGHIQNVIHFNNLCDHINYLVMQDQELLHLHHGRLNSDCYIDENYHILTQDVIYACVAHINLEVVVTTEKEALGITIKTLSVNQISVATTNVSFTGSITNHLQNNKENKRIGDLGELFVIQLEKEKLEKANKPKLAKKVAHHAKDKGDGLGYDVLSYDENGNKIYIEVKATKSGKNTTFFITRNELARSKQEQNNYYIYRVYNFNDETFRGDVLVLQGDASNLCIEAVNYKVKMM